MELTPAQQKAKRRQDLQAQIVAVDRKMSLELEQKIGRVPKLKPRETGFPWINWIIAAMAWGWVFYGDQISRQIHMETLFWTRLAAIIFVIAALASTIKRAFNAHYHRTRRVPINDDETEAVRQLRLRRDALQKELESLK